MPRNVPIQHQINQRVQEALRGAQSSLPARPPNPDHLPLEEFDARSVEVPGPLDAREVLRRLMANAPNWVRAAIGMRLLVTTWLRWHPPIPKDAFSKFELRPGGRIQDFELSTVCGANKVIAFVQDKHIYVQFEIGCRPGHGTTIVNIVTRTAAKTRTGLGHLRLVKQTHLRVMKALLPGVSIADPNFPAMFPDYTRPGFRQQSRKQLQKQGLLPEQIQAKVKELQDKEKDVPRVEIPKKPGLLGKLFGKRS